MSGNFEFSDICGQNVKLSNDRTVVTWTPVCSQGQAISEAELRPGDVVEVRVEGSGRCDVGFIMGSQDYCNFLHSSEIRVNKTSCMIEILYNKDVNEIRLKHDQKTFPISMENETKIWIATCIQYGDIWTELISQGSLLEFCSKNKGMNISLENDKTRCLPKCKNPSSVCFISEQIVQGNTILFDCTSVTEGGRKPCQRELKMFVSEKDPALFESLFKYVESNDRNSHFLLVEILRKEECDGIITIFLSKHKTIECTTPKGKQRLSVDANKGLWVVFDLYGVKVHAVKKTDVETSECVSRENQIDSVCDNHRKKAIEIIEKPLNFETGNDDLHQRVGYLEQKFENHDLDSQTDQDNDDFSLKPGIENSSKEINGEKINIQTHYDFLVEELNSVHFCDQLFMRGLINFGQTDAIQTLQNRGSSVANRELLKIMERKQIEKSDMENIVEKVGQPHLLHYFYPNEERKKKRKDKNKQK